MGRVVRGVQAAAFCGRDRLTLYVHRKLETANTFHGRHWWKKHKESAAWEAAILSADGFVPGVFLPDGRRVRITFIRQVASTRSFIRDADNLLFSTKAAVDALKRLGLIVDDTMTWVDRPMPTQEVSPDKDNWTIITLEKLEESR